MLVAFRLAGEARFFAPPLAFSFVGGVAGVIVYGIGRARAVARYAGVVVALLPAVPTLFFVVAELVGPGAGAYATGPFIHLYAFTVVATGFLLRPRAALVAGAVAAAGLAVVWLLSRESCARRRAPRRSCASI